ncbi:hypothetical protein PHYSODRAFT_515292, partial [Phytophthora sojae]
DVWRLVLGDDPPVDVEPMRVHMKAGCRPFKAKARKYAPAYQAFLESFNDMLVKLGWVYENPTMSRAPIVHDAQEDLHSTTRTSRQRRCSTVLPVHHGALLRRTIVQAFISLD